LHPQHPDDADKNTVKQSNDYLSITDAIQISGVFKGEDYLAGFDNMLNATLKSFADNLSAYFNPHSYRRNWCSRII